MILDTIEGLTKYLPQLPELAAVLELLHAGTIAQLPDGKHLLQGEALYVNVSRSATVPWMKKQFEGHRLYVDVQCVLSGQETIGYAPIRRLVTAVPYDPNSDLQFYEDRDGYSTALTLQEGMAAVFFPEDAHKPGCVCGAASTVHKAVFKVLIK